MLPFRPRLSALAIIAAAAAGCTHGSRQVPQPSPQASPLPTAVTYVTSPLNGAAVLPSSVKHRVAAVMIDNYPYDARPQSGLGEADIVYEVEAEGGITRYMALYLENAPPKIGPVRSARLYFVDLARPYNPLFAHAGENDDVWGPLQDLREAGFADVEEILGVGEAFWRDDSREMPHNLYTSIAKLREAAPNHGWQDTQFSGPEFAFADPSPPKSVPDVIVDFWKPYEVRFGYDGRAYRRYIGGAVQRDSDNAAPYEVADIVAVWIPATVIDDLGDLKMNVYGTFPALAIRDGLVTSCTWKATGPDTLPRLTDPSGDPVLLSPGQVYIEMLPQGGRVAVGNQSWTH
jgi:DUF3048 family protein